MEIKISGTPEEIKELLQVIVSNEEQLNKYFCGTSDWAKRVPTGNECTPD